MSKGVVCGDGWCHTGGLLGSVRQYSGWHAFQPRGGRQPAENQPIGLRAPRSRQGMNGNYGEHGKRDAPPHHRKSLNGEVFPLRALQGARRAKKGSSECRCTKNLYVPAQSSDACSIFHTIWFWSIRPWTLLSTSMETSTYFHAGMSTARKFPQHPWNLPPTSTEASTNAHGSTFMETSMENKYFGSKLDYTSMQIYCHGRFHQLPWELELGQLPSK